VLLFDLSSGSKSAERGPAHHVALAFNQVKHHSKRWTEIHSAQLKERTIMAERRRYRKRASQFIVAVQLKMETEGFVYQKWGGEQRCKQGDWLVDNQGDVYSVDRETFDQTYEKKSPGRFVKTTPIWAEQATASGEVTTKEGISHYQAGDYLVSNNEDGSDAYCISKEKFESMYEPADGR
jgi:hypothetical protein